MSQGFKNPYLAPFGGGSCPFSAERFFPDSPVYLPQQKPKLLKTNSKWERWTNSRSVDCHLFILLYLNTEGKFDYKLSASIYYRASVLAPGTTCSHLRLLAMRCVKKVIT